ncbi:acylphosphatase [Methylobacterium sp. BTF04]|uniref:acylphosphatase n=1 Tax=Methylobacterium sp. BTF04 TaxID=2708300 RepID=UPI0013D2EA02|nr:acylphosphatase [Methylobacterium sp. BTF04]NEU12201.1 acylphosphatase [Methylobacterium sp. BTF04]
MTADIRVVEAVIRGRVQGVGYRIWIRREADRHGLSGHVRNRADGTVEALLSGESEAVAAMLAACRHGPPGAQVTDIAVTERGTTPLPPGFSIRPE